VGYFNHIFTDYYIIAGRLSGINEDNLRDVPFLKLFLDPDGAVCIPASLPLLPHLPDDELAATNPQIIVNLQFFYPTYAHRRSIST